MTEQIINPRLFKPAVRKVRFMHRPKFYLARLQLQDIEYPLRGDYLVNPDGKFKTRGAAFNRSQRVHARWCRLYDAVIVAAIAAESPASSLQKVEA